MHRQAAKKKPTDVEHLNADLGFFLTEDHTTSTTAHYVQKNTS